MLKNSSSIPPANTAGNDNGNVPAATPAVGTSVSDAEWRARKVALITGAYEPKDALLFLPSSINSIH